MDISELGVLPHVTTEAALSEELPPAALPPATPIADSHNRGQSGASVPVEDPVPPLKSSPRKRKKSKPKQAAPGSKKKKQKVEKAEMGGGGEGGLGGGGTTEVPMGAYSAREMFLVGMEEQGELAFKYVKNDGTDDNLKW